MSLHQNLHPTENEILAMDGSLLQILASSKFASAVPGEDTISVKEMALHLRNELGPADPFSEDLVAHDLSYAALLGWIDVVSDGIFSPTHEGQGVCILIRSKVGNPRIQKILKRQTLPHCLLAEGDGHNQIPLGL